MRLTGFTAMAVGLLGLVLWHLSISMPSNQDHPVLLAHELEPGAPNVSNEVQPSNPSNSDQAVEGFKFPDDQCGMILAKILTPSGTTMRSAPSPPATPRLLPAPHHLDHPTAPLPAAHVEMARLPQTKRPFIKPRPLSDEWPVLGSQWVPDLPQPRVLPAEKRVRVPSVDPHLPVPLPTLAQPVSDRAPVEDATGDASLRGVLSNLSPSRTSPAPFTKTNSPDPFENRLKTPEVPENGYLPVYTGSKPAK